MIANGGVKVSESNSSDLELLLRRRRWLLGGTAALAAVGGAVLAWRNSKNTALPPANDSDAMSPRQFWDLKFDTPSGQPLVLSSLRGKRLLLNFWATWCPPCVEELPLINSFYRENSNKNWQVLGLAVDQLDLVKTFLSRSPVDFPVALAGLSGVGLTKSLGNLSGSLPFTVVFDSDGSVLRRKIGRVTPEDLRAWGALK
jgi:thiol-disulfide isomerase/thioredoxin